MTRIVYRGLVWLHPPSFRRQFSGEMLWIFDEAAAAYGAAALLADAALSLVRQWFIGWGAWKIFAALLGGSLQMLLFSGWTHLASTPARNLPLPHTFTTADIEFSRALAPLAVLLVLGIALRNYAGRTRKAH